MACRSAVLICGCATLQSARDAALEREAALEAEKAQLKAGLGGALEQRQALEAQLGALAAQQQSLRQTVRTLHSAACNLEWTSGWAC